MKTSEANAAEVRAIWPAPSRRTKSAVAVRNATITSAAIVPIAWIGSARQRSKLRRTESM